MKQMSQQAERLQFKDILRSGKTGTVDNYLILYQKGIRNASTLFSSPFLIILLDEGLRARER